MDFNYDFRNAKVIRGKIPEGAVRMHLYPVAKVLAPRGSLKKESLSEHILEALNNYYESWTDAKYGDNPPKEVLQELLHSNLEQETRIAWREFMLQNRFSK
jgi:hypothetical protein